VFIQKKERLVHISLMVVVYLTAMSAGLIIQTILNFSKQK
jgi:hypothetical protein